MSIQDIEIGVWTAIAAYGLSLSTLNLTDTWRDKLARDREQKNGIMRIIADTSLKAEMTRWVQQFAMFTAGAVNYLPIRSNVKGFLVVVSLFIAAGGLVQNTRRARKFREELGYRPMNFRELIALAWHGIGKWRMMLKSSRKDKGNAG